MRARDSPWTGPVPVYDRSAFAARRPSPGLGWRLRTVTGAAGCRWAVLGSPTGCMQRAVLRAAFDCDDRWWFSPVAQGLAAGTNNDGVHGCQLPVTTPATELVTVASICVSDDETRSAGPVSAQQNSTIVRFVQFPGAYSVQSGPAIGVVGRPASARIQSSRALRCANSSSSSSTVASTG